MFNYSIENEVNSEPSKQPCSCSGRATNNILSESNIITERTEQDADGVNLGSKKKKSIPAQTSSQTCPWGWKAHLRGTSTEGEPEVLPRIRYSQGWAPTMIHHMGRNCQDCKPNQKLRDVRQRSRDGHKGILLGGGSVPHESKTAEWPQEDAMHFSTHLHKDSSVLHQIIGDVIMFAATVNLLLQGMYLV